MTYLFRATNVKTISIKDLISDFLLRNNFVSTKERSENDVVLTDQLHRSRSAGEKTDELLGKNSDSPRYELF